MSSLPHFWSRVADAGVYAGQSSREQRSIALLNRVCMVAILLFVSLSLTTVPLSQRSYPAQVIFLNLLDIFVFSLVIFLQYRRKIIFARNFFIIYGTLRISLNLYFIPVEAMAQVTFLPLLLMNLIIFNNKRVMAGYFIFILVAFSVSTAYQLTHPPVFDFPFTNSQLRYHALGNIFVNIFVLSFAIVYFFRGLSNRYEHKLEQQKAELQEQKEELSTTMEQLKAAQMKLVESEKLASLGEITAGVAHEINNPVNFVSGNIFPLRQDLQDLQQIIEKLKENHPVSDSILKQSDYEFLKSEIRNLLDGMEVGTRRIRDIVQGLRNFSRMDEDVFKPGDLNAGLESTILILNNKFKNRIEIVKDFGELPPVTANHGKLNQVFMNLINNSIDAIEGIGCIYLNTRLQGDRVVVEVNDNGAGIPPAISNKIFEPFFTTKDIGKGTGLGLSISKGIVEAHHGTISITSQPGKGTRVLLEIPVSREGQEN